MSQIPPSLPPAGGTPPQRGASAQGGDAALPADLVNLGGAGDDLGQLLQDVKDLAARKGGTEGLPLLNPENSGEVTAQSGCGGGGTKPAPPSGGCGGGGTKPAPPEPPAPPCPAPPSGGCGGGSTRPAPPSSGC